MTGPRVWISPTASARVTGAARTRHDVEPGVTAARRTARVWAGSPVNAARLHDHFGARIVTPPPDGVGLAEIAELLVAWGVPGVRPPADVGAGTAKRWARSVAAAVLRQLRHDSGADRSARTRGQPSNGPAPAWSSGSRSAARDGVTTRAGAPSTGTDVAAVAAVPHPAPDVDEVSLHFAAVPLHVEPGNPYLQRLDAQADVDSARRRHTAARRALAAATEGAPPGAVLAEAATADDARATLRAAVGVLRSLDTLHGVDVSATIEIEVDVDGPLVVIHPRGELDLFTSPHLERATVGRLDAARVGRVLVDLTAVTFLDSSGLAVLVEIRRTCLEGGTAFALTGLSDRSRRLLAITRLDTVFDVV